MLLTTQYLDEAEQLADRIAILHEGRIIVYGTLAELKKLLPPAKVEYVEKQPTLEEVFLAIVGKRRSEETTMTRPHFFGDTASLLGRSLRHITRSVDTIITTTIMPIAFMLLFVYVFGGAIDAGTDYYVNYLLPGILLITIASGISYTAFRLFLDMKSGIFERFHSMPIARSSVLWAHVLTSLVANADLDRGRHRCVALLMGFRSRRRRAGVARGGRHPRAVHPRVDVDRRDPRPHREVRRRRQRLLLPAHLPAVRQLGVRADRDDARTGARVRREPAGDVDRQRDPRPVRRAAGRRRHLGRARLVRRHPRRRVQRRHGRLPPQDLLTVRRSDRRLRVVRVPAQPAPPSSTASTSSEPTSPSRSARRLASARLPTPSLA